MRVTTICLALSLMTPLAARAQPDPLQPLSRSELQRVFGTTPAASVPVVGDAMVSALSGTNPIEAVDDLRQMSNAGSVNSNVLLHLLRPSTPPGPNDPEVGLRYLLLWHQIALDVTAIDHAPTGEGVAQQQFGPGRTARALALVHQAMFEAAAQFSNNRYETTLPGLPILDGSDASMEAAITEAAYLTLDWLYPRLNETPIHSAPPSG